MGILSPSTEGLSPRRWGRFVKALVGALVVVGPLVNVSPVAAAVTSRVDRAPVVASPAAPTPVSPALGPVAPVPTLPATAVAGTLEKHAP